MKNDNKKFKILLGLHLKEKLFQKTSIRMHTLHSLNRQVHLEFMIMQWPKVKIMLEIFNQLMIRPTKDSKVNVKKSRKSENLNVNNLIGKKRNKT